MKRKRSRSQTILILIVLAIIVYLELEEQRQQNTPAAPTAVALATLTLAAPSETAEAAAPSATIQPTLSPTPTENISATPQATKLPLATDIPGLVMTPMSGTLYEITGTVNALGCPDSRCKVIDAYKKRNIIVVTGIVMGTTYKTKKTRVWYQVIYHDGRKVYVHGAFAQPYEAS